MRGGAGGRGGGEFITASNEAERRDPFVTDRDSSANGEL